MTALSKSLAQLILLIVAMSAENLWAQDCPDLSGTWSVTETITLTTTINDESETITEADTDSLELIQNGCTVQFFRLVPVPGGGTFQAERVGTIEGDTVTFTGIAAVPAQTATCSENSFVAVGTIDGNRIDAITAVDVQCTAPGIVQTVTGNGTATFSRNPELNWVKTASGNIAVGIDIAVDGSGKSYVIGSLVPNFDGENSAIFGAGEPNETTLVSTGDLSGCGTPNGTCAAFLFVAKYDSRGLLIWAKRAVQGQSLIEGGGIGIDTAGNSYITGGYYESATFAPGEPNEVTLLAPLNYDIFVAKYDVNGALVWARRAGGLGLDSGKSIAVDSLGNSYVTGGFDAPPGFSSAIFGAGESNETALNAEWRLGIFVAKYDTNGNLDWAKGVSGYTGDGTQSGFGIAVDNAGNSHVTGGFAGVTTFGAEENNETILVSTRYSGYL